LTLLDEEGVENQNIKGIERTIILFFDNLFSTSQNLEMDDVVDYVELCVSAEMNERLYKAYTKEEVGVTLKQTHPYEALCSDGLNPYF